jgi:hypothetical protein
MPETLPRQVPSGIAGDFFIYLILLGVHGANILAPA